jgi:hypothetical protein
MPAGGGRRLGSLQGLSPAAGLKTSTRGCHTTHTAGLILQDSRQATAEKQPRRQQSQLRRCVASHRKCQSRRAVPNLLKKNTLEKTNTCEAANRWRKCLLKRGNGSLEAAKRLAKARVEAVISIEVRTSAKTNRKDRNSISDGFAPPTYGLLSHHYTIGFTASLLESIDKKKSMDFHQCLLMTSIPAIMIVFTHSRRSSASRCESQTM